MNILSLFDWISCGRVALERAWIQVDKYFASEIDKYAIQVSKKNYPDTIHIGNVTDVEYHDWFLYSSEVKNDITKVDIYMIIWWSPCQDLSIAKKDGKWLQWEKSWLFFEYVRLLKEVKPKYFLLENVASMKKEDKEEITRILMEIYPDTQCHLINSALVSAQNRKRLYWTNIQWVTQPKDKGILLKDILENNVDESYNMSEKATHRAITNPRSRIASISDAKCWAILANQSHQSTDMVSLRVDEKVVRKLTPIECERLQTLSDNYSEWISNTQRYKSIWNGWTVDVIAHIFSHIT
jgi:DNA (cytosine-5)-methyltransferase 3A